MRGSFYYILNYNVTAEKFDREVEIRQHAGCKCRAGLPTSKSLLSAFINFRLLKQCGR